MRIRSKISLQLGLFICVVIGAIFVLNYVIVRQSLMKDAQLQLVKTEQNMQRAAQTLLSTAIKNYLRGITEKNIDFIEEMYASYQRKEVSSRQAKALVQAHFNQQSVGKSGYLVAVEERKGRAYLDLHPFLPGSECTATEGCRAWISTRNGYTEYDWKNPADNSYKKKAAYVKEFPDWNWIVGASSYREEFVSLVNISDLRELLSPFRINKTGYFFVFDQNYRILIHPEIENTDGLLIKNRDGESLLKLLLESENGFLTYLWKNPSDQRERWKYAYIEKLEGYNWYLVASVYLSEVYEPIAYLKNLTIFMILLLFTALLGIILKISKQIAAPLQKIERGIVQFDENKDPFVWCEQKIDEINMLGNAFARMTTELNRSMMELHDKNAALEVSERDKETSRVFLDSIINSMPSLIIGVDPGLNVTQWNIQAEKMTGISPVEAKGKSIFALLPELNKYQHEIRQALGAGEVLTIPHSASDEGGQIHYLEIILSPMITEGNEGAVIRIDEITERVEMEQRLRQSQKMDAIGQLAGGVAHDFNNMLSGILGAAELLQLRTEPKNQKLVKIVRESAERAGELIKKLLSFSRKEKIAYVPVNITTVLQDTVDILKRTLDKRIRVESQLEERAITVMGDLSELQNSLLNIGINGGHAMQDGGTLVFKSSLVELDENYCKQSPFNISPGQYVQMSIKDSGSGISKENLKHIFEPFFTTRDPSKGTGLGLAAVYGAVQQHRGAISVNSEEGRGTEFVIVLPATGEKQVEQQTNENYLQGEGCILVIDDEAVVRATAKMMLESVGYEVLEADNGQSGVEVYKQNQDKIALVLLDMLMPVMDGTECFYRLKKINSQVCVIISSGYTRDADLATLKDDGLCGLVRKPYTLQELAQAVGSAMGNRLLERVN